MANKGLFNCLSSKDKANSCFPKVGHVLIMNGVIMALQVLSYDIFREMKILILQPVIPLCNSVISVISVTPYIYIYIYI